MRSLSVSLYVVIEAEWVGHRGYAGTLSVDEVVRYGQESDPLLLRAEVVGLGDA